MLFYAAVCILVLGVLLAMDWGFQLQLVVGVSALASYVGFRVGVAEGRIAEQIRESERRYHELRRRLFAADSPGEVDDARGAVPRLEDDGDSLSPNSEP